MKKSVRILSKSEAANSVLPHAAPVKASRQSFDDMLASASQQTEGADAPDSCAASASNADPGTVTTGQHANQQQATSKRARPDDAGTGTQSGSMLPQMLRKCDSADGTASEGIHSTVDKHDPCSSSPQEEESKTDKASKLREPVLAARAGGDVAGLSVPVAAEPLRVISPEVPKDRNTCADVITSVSSEGTGVRIPQGSAQTECDFDGSALGASVTKLQGRQCEQTSELLVQAGGDGDRGGKADPLPADMSIAQAGDIEAKGAPDAASAQSSVGPALVQDPSHRTDPRHGVILPSSAGAQSECRSSVPSLETAGQPISFSLHPASDSRTQVKPSSIPSGKSGEPGEAGSDAYSYSSNPPPSHHGNAIDGQNGNGPAQADAAGLSQTLTLALHGNGHETMLSGAAPGNADGIIHRTAASEDTVAGKWAGGELAGTAGISTAKLVQTINNSEMRVGLHSSEFGAISIRTILSQQQMQAHILVDHNELVSALSVHIPSIQAKLGSEYGVHASIELNQSGAGFSSGGQHSSQREQPTTTVVAIHETQAGPAGDIVAPHIAIMTSYESRLDVRA